MNLNSLNQHQRKIILICLGIFGALYACRAIANYALRRAYEQRQLIQEARRQKPSPNRKQIAAMSHASPVPETAPATSTFPATSPAGEAAPPQNDAAPRLLPPPLPLRLLKVVGRWWGRIELDGRGICPLNLEITQPPETPGRFSGLISMTCGAAPRAKDRINAEGAMLDGFVEAESVRFKIIQTIGTDSHGCAFSSIVATPAPMGNQLAVQFKEDSCAGGDVIFRRNAR